MHDFGSKACTFGMHQYKTFSQEPRMHCQEQAAYRQAPPNMLQQVCKGTLSPVKMMPPCSMMAPNSLTAKMPRSAARGRSLNSAPSFSMVACSSASAPAQLAQSLLACK